MPVRAVFCVHLELLFVPFDLSSIQAEVSLQGKSVYKIFGNLRYNEITQQNDHIVLSSADGGKARGHTSNACNACRARKVSMV